MSSLHSKSPWYKSKGAQGTIGPVERARVMDLQSLDDSEKPLSPAHRVFASMWCGILFILRVCKLPAWIGLGKLFSVQVMQKGVAATVHMLNYLFDGLPSTGQPNLLLVDLMPNRQVNLMAYVETYHSNQHWLAGSMNGVWQLGACKRTRCSPVDVAHIVLISIS